MTMPPSGNETTGVLVETNRRVLPAENPAGTSMPLGTDPVGTPRSGACSGVSRIRRM